MFHGTYHQKHVKLMGHSFTFFKALMIESLINFETEN